MVHLHLRLKNLLYVSRLRIYWDDCNNSKLIQIVEDRDVSWPMLILYKSFDNYLFVIIDSESFGVVGSSTFFNSKLPRSKNSHHDTRIVILRIEIATKLK